MELINTIEISPYSFAKSEYSSPNGSAKELPEEWTKFWYKCISDSGLQNLTPIALGSYLVDIESVSPVELEIIIKNEIKDIDLDEYEDQISMISGGIVIKKGSEIVIEPTCCGDIGNLIKWEKISSATTSSWNQLWIGHPWIFYKKRGGLIEFSDYTDFDVNIDDIETKCKISEEWLIESLHSLRIKQSRFERMISEALFKLNINNPDKIAALMTGSIL